MKIVLIRHGESEGNVLKTYAGHADFPLTQKGREQAKKVGKELLETGIKFAAVYSSDIVRAAETAKIICKELGIGEIIYDKRLREGDVGIYTGRKRDSVSPEEKEFIERILTDIDLRVPGGETNREMTHRIKEVFLELLEKHQEDSTLLLIGHGGTLYHLLVKILELLPTKLEEWFSSCQMNVIKRKSKNDTWSLVMFNNKPIDSKNIDKYWKKRIREV